MSSTMLQSFTNGARHAYTDAAGTWIRESRNRSWVDEEEQPMTSVLSIQITGAFTQIGAVSADRFARRGHGLLLVAHDRARKEWSTNVED